MSWDAEVQELQRRRYLAQQQGGEAGIAKQHARGRMTIRERIDVLLDEGSFREHGRATASPVYDDNDELIEYVPANYIVGFGAIEGRRVTVGGEDFTLKGGSPNAAGLRKSVYAEHLAVQYRTPLVRMLEGVSPLPTLARGYAIVRSTEGRVIESADALNAGDRVTAQFAKGTVTAVVENIDPMASLQSGNLYPNE